MWVWVCFLREQQRNNDGLPAWPTLILLLLVVLLLSTEHCPQLDSAARPDDFDVRALLV